MRLSKKYILLIFSLLIILVSLGVVIYNLWPQERDIYQDFKDGKATFCNLDELQKFYVCPRVRILEQVENGYIITYICNEDEAYVIVSADIKTTAKIYNDMLKLETHGVEANINCQDKYEEEEIMVFHLLKTGKLKI